MPLEFPEPLDVIAVGAHPDDVEIACGGTLAKLVRQGYRVGIVDLTDGEPTPGSPGPEVRLAEAAEAAKILGVQMRDHDSNRRIDGYRQTVSPGNSIKNRWIQLNGIGNHGDSVIGHAEMVKRCHCRGAVGDGKINSSQCFGFELED